MPISILQLSCIATVALGALYEVQDSATIEKLEEHEVSKLSVELLQKSQNEAKGKMATARALRAHFLDTLYVGRDPFSLVGKPALSNWGYGGTKIREDFIDLVLKNIQPTFWVEIGSMIGGSAVKVASRAKANSMDTFIFCMDPWTGDVNMWAWEEEDLKKNQPQDSLFMDEYGHTRIYETFLNNVANESHDDIILPLRVSSIVGIRLLGRLRDEKRLPQAGGKQLMPQVIYLDSAHEKDETLMEIRAAYEILPPGGVLMGDDWGWDAVRNDVMTFARSMAFQEISEEKLKLYDLVDATAKQPLNGLVVVGCDVPLAAIEYCKTKGQWMLFK